MGLYRSFKRRLRLVEGESFATSARLLFSSRKVRRDFETNKFWNDHNHFQSDMYGLGLTDEMNLIRACLEPEWYAQTHGLSNGKDCLNHYLSEGRKKAFAPCRWLATEDQKTLSHWGLEYLARCGLQLGDTSEECLRPGDDRAIDPFNIANPNGKKIAVVTANYGGYDRLLPVDNVWAEKSDFFVFSDNYFNSSPSWTHVHSPFHHIDPRRKARFIKLNLPLFFQKYEWVVWIDGNVLLCREPESIIADTSNAPFDFATFIHPNRSSVISEAAACVQFGKENVRGLAEHLARIGISSKTANNNLYETMVLVVQPSSPAVQTLFMRWSGYVSRGSKRDQISLPLALSEVPEIKFAPLLKDIKTSGDFFRTKHLSSMGKT